MGFHVSGAGRSLGAAARGDGAVDAVNSRATNVLRIGGFVAVAAAMALLALINHRGLQIFGWVLTRLEAGDQAIDTLRTGHDPAVGMLIVAMTSLLGCFRCDHCGRFSGWPILAFLLSVLIWMVLQIAVLRSMVVPFMGYPMDYNSVQF